MSVTVNGTLLKNQLNESSISVTQAEYSLDGAINLLNTFGANLTMLTGAAGSKTGTYTSAQAGAILTMAQQIYAKHYKNAAGVSGSNTGILSQNYAADVDMLAFAKVLAGQCVGRGFRRA